MEISSGRVHLEVRCADEETGWVALERLRGEPEAVVVESPRRGMVPIIPFVIAVTIAIHALTGLIMWLRAKNGCQQIIDVRGEKIISEENCAVKDGRIIIVAKDGVKVEIVEAPSTIDLTEVLKAAMTLGGASAKSAAASLGASVS